MLVDSVTESHDCNWKTIFWPSCKVCTRQMRQTNQIEMEMTKNLLAVRSKITTLNTFYDKSFLAVAENIAGRFTCASPILRWVKLIRFNEAYLSRVRDNRWYALHFLRSFWEAKKINYSMTLSSAWSLFLDCFLSLTLSIAHTCIHSLFRHFFPSLDSYSHNHLALMKAKSILRLNFV